MGSHCKFFFNLAVCLKICIIIHLEIKNILHFTVPSSLKLLSGTTATERRENSWIQFKTCPREGSFSSLRVFLYCMMRRYEPLVHILSLLNHDIIQGASKSNSVNSSLHLLKPVKKICLRNLMPSFQNCFLVIELYRTQKRIP